MSLPEISSLVTILALILAGVWTLYRFGIAREQYPKLQFDLKVKSLGISRDKKIVELIAVITNKLQMPNAGRQHSAAYQFKRKMICHKTSLKKYKRLA